MNKNQFNQVYTPSNRNEIEKLVHIYREILDSEETLANPAVLNSAELVFTGWGAPRMDQTFLDNAPLLKAVFYGAGSVRKMLTPSFWKKSIKLTSASTANARPVAEFTLSMIIIALKKVWHHIDAVREAGNFKSLPVPGAYKSTIGLISLGAIGRKVVELLKSFDLNLIVYDPFISDSETRESGLKRIYNLDELFKLSDVVSLHTPLLKETENMITGRHFSLMKKSATFINTARGALVNEKEMIQVLQERKDLSAMLDVTFPEPPIKGSPLYTMKNIFLTPHIAGSLDGECGRMGYFMVEELRRYINNEEFKWNITEEKAKTLA